MIRRSISDIRTAKQAWEQLVGDQTVAEWLEYDGPVTAEGIAAHYLHPESFFGCGVFDERERDRLARLLEAWIQDHIDDPQQTEEEL